MCIRSANGCAAGLNCTNERVRGRDQSTRTKGFAQGACHRRWRTGRVSPFARSAAIKGEGTGAVTATRSYGSAPVPIFIEGHVGLAHSLSL